MNWWNSEPQETGPRLAINQKFADFWRDLWISPETCLEIAPPLTTHVNPPGNLHAGGEGDIYRIIISEYSVSGVIIPSLLGINITNDNVVTTCGWDCDNGPEDNNYEIAAHTNVIPQSNRESIFN